MYMLTLKVLVTTIDAQWEGMGDVGSAGTTSPMLDHKGFKLQELVNFQKFSTLKVRSGLQSMCKRRLPWRSA